MRILLLTSPDGDTIAREEQFGRREGQFVVAADASVVYRHAWDEREWFAGNGESPFRAAAEAWNAYTQTVVDVPDPEEQAVVARLREELIRIGVLSARPDSIWRVLLEQAEAGML